MKKLTIAALVALQSCTGAVGGSTVVPETVQTASTAAAVLASALDLRALPVDDNYWTLSGAKKGWIYACRAPMAGGPGTTGTMPWIDSASGTWSLLAKPAVAGKVSWASSYASTVSGATRSISGNGLPSHATGTFPIAASDPAYKYDRNSSTISSQSLSYAISSNPKVASTPSCVDMGAVGVMTTGAVLFNALDAQGRDAAAHEVLDRCWGHPQEQGVYHYHTYSSCMKDTKPGHSALLGYALDGFGIYGVRGTGGTQLRTSDLDACHGHAHEVVWNGKSVRMYHYHFTYDYPYSIGCYRGTPVRSGPPS